MIVTIDNNTQPVELYHLSILFQSLAKAHGFVAPVTSVTIDPTPEQAAVLRQVIEDNKHGEMVVIREPGVVHNVDIVGVVTPPVDLAQAESNAEVETERQSTDIAVTTDTSLDINGLPWDARIHAGSRERNTDGSWRVRRRPKDTDQDAWDATLARVTAELTDLMAIPVSPGAVADAAAEEALTDAEVDELVNIIGGVVEPTVIEGVGSYTEVEGSVPPPTATVADAVAALNAVAPPVTIVPPVVVPPVTAVAPPITVIIETFPQVMVWLTAHTPKDEAAKPVMVTKVNQILTDNGLTVLQQLNQRPDLIPQIMSQFIEAFGE